MKKITLLIFSFLFIISTYSQEFVWAHSYDISNCNEIAAQTVNADGDLYGCGIHDAPDNLPYTGDAYIIKTDDQGSVIWTEYFLGTLIISDIAALGNGVVIMGQSTYPFEYKGISYGLEDYFMFIIMLDEEGDVIWFRKELDKYGANGNIEIDQDKIAIHVRGQYNLGDYVYILDSMGNILNDRLITSSTTIVDLAFFNNHVYVSGSAPNQETIIIDGITIEPPQIENASFVVAFDESMTAIWATTDSTINNRDGRIEANESGVFVYESVLRPGFNIINSLKKISFDGQVINEVEPPFFSNAISLYPDMVVTDERIAIFSQNAYDFSSHKVMIFDHDLNLITEKTIDGPSDLYSGQICSNGYDMFLGHVHTGDLNFDNDLLLQAINSDKHLYLSKIATDIPSNIMDSNITQEINIFPNPSNGIVNIKILSDHFSNIYLSVVNINGQILMEKTISNNDLMLDLNELSNGIYLLKGISSNGFQVQKTFQILK